MSGLVCVNVTREKTKYHLNVFCGDKGRPYTEDACLEGQEV